MPPPLRALVTGFGPFPGIIDNASAAVAPRLAERMARELPGVQALPAILPTEWEAAPRLLSELVAQAQPHVCVHLGVSGAACGGMVVETFARNWAGDKRDAVNRLPRCSQLLADAPPLLLPVVNPLGLVGRLARAGLPVVHSLETGDYVCNAVYFHSLWLARRCGAMASARRQVIFIHLPVRVGSAGRAEDFRDEAETLAMDSALAAIMLLLRGMLEAAGNRQQAVVDVIPCAAHHKNGGPRTG